MWARARAFVALQAVVEVVTVEETQCSAQLFADGEFNAATNAGGPLTLAVGRHDLWQLLSRGAYDLASWRIHGIRSAIVSGIVGHCTLSLFETSSEDVGWRTTLGVGRFTFCFLQAHGAPWRLPRYAVLGHDLKIEGPGALWSIPDSVRVWQGPGIITRVSTFRHFQLTFQLQASSSPQPICATPTPLLEFLTSGYTVRSEYFNSSDDGDLLAIGNAVKVSSRPELTEAMIKPILSIWILPPHDAKPQSRIGASECRLVILFETKNFPTSDPIRCESTDKFLIGQEPVDVLISFSPDHILRAFVQGQRQLQCGPLESSVPMQRNVEVSVGSRFWEAAPPSALVIIEPRYRLVGPLGTFAPQLFHGRSAGGVFPRIIHQVWLGDNEPRVLTDTWRAYALFTQTERGGWEHWLWRSEEAIASAVFGAKATSTDKLLANLRPFYEEELTAAGRSDFLRWSLLYLFGGVYVDADAMWLGPPAFLDHLLEEASFVAAWQDKYELLVATGIIAGLPRAPVVQRMLELQIQLYGHCRGDLERRPWDVLALGALTHLVTSEFANDASVRILPHTAFYPVAHHQDPWGQYGRGLPTFKDEMDSCSVDLGLGTNLLDVHIFRDQVAGAYNGVNSQRADLIGTWQFILSRGLDAIVDEQDLAGCRRGASPPSAAPYFGGFDTGFPWGARLEGFPKTMQVHDSGTPATQLMIVSHADDESLFGSATFADTEVVEQTWLLVVVCAPDDIEAQETRRNELLKALDHVPTVAAVTLLGFPECSKCFPVHSDFYSDLGMLMLDRQWLRVVTHGPFGEYGHPQHREVYLAVVSLVAKSVPVWVFQPTRTEASPFLAHTRLHMNMIASYSSQQQILNGFQHLHPAAVPLPRFNITKARKVCMKSAGSAVYYQRTCGLPANPPGNSNADPRNGAFLCWESHAFPLQYLARELAQTVDVGLYGAPSLRRFLYGHAAESGVGGLGCFAGVTSALTWIALAATHQALILPLATLPGRFLQDVTSSILTESAMKTQILTLGSSSQQKENKGPTRVSQAVLSKCNFLFGPAASTLRALGFARNSVGVHHLAIHGDVDLASDATGRLFNTGIEKTTGHPPQVPVEGEARAVMRSILRALWFQGWVVDLTESNCLIEESHERVWSWSTSIRDDTAEPNALAVNRFACWIEVSIRTDSAA